MIYYEVKKEREGVIPGLTPVAKRNQSLAELDVSASDLTKEERMKRVVSSDPTISPHIITFSQDLVAGELSEQMFRYSSLTFSFFASGMLNHRATFADYGIRL